MIRTTGDTIALSPPLIISAAEIERIVSILALAALGEVLDELLGPLAAAGGGGGGGKRQGARQRDRDVAAAAGGAAGALASARARWQTNRPRRRLLLRLLYLRHWDGCRVVGPPS